MNVIQNYFDFLCQDETDEILNLIWNSTGRNLGILMPYSWDLRPPKRFWTLAKHSAVVVLLCFIIGIVCVTASLSYKLDTAFTIESLTIGVLFLFPLLFTFINIYKHRSLCSVFKFINDGFVVYQDFPENEELEIRNKLKNEVEFCRKFWFICLFSGGPVGLFMIYTDNRSRDLGSLPYNINTALPLPIWTGMDTRSPFLTILWTILQAVFMVVLVSFMYGLLNGITKLVLTYINECQVVAEALRKQEKRAVRTYVDFMKSQGVDVDESGLTMLKLYRDELFLQIFQHCYKKIIDHHHIMVRYLGFINDIYGGVISVIEYTYGGLLALCLCTALDDSLTISLRIFLSLVTIVIFGFLWFICFFSQKATDVMKNLHEEIYMSHWVDANQEFKNIVKIFHTLSQKPGNVKSILGSSLDNSSMIKVLQACYSILNFIQFRKN